MGTVLGTVSRSATGVGGDVSSLASQPWLAAAASSRLTPQECARLDRLRHPEDRASYLAAHILVRECAAELIGCDPTDLALVQHCDGCGGDDHGRPALRGTPTAAPHVDQHGGRRFGRSLDGSLRAFEAPSVGGAEVRVSLSHTRGYAAAIASLRDCGIDVEGGGGSIPRGVLTATEADWLRVQQDQRTAFTQLWTRKESLIKAGLGSLDRAHQLDALHLPGGVKLHDWAPAAATVASAAEPPAAVRGAWCLA